MDQPQKYAILVHQTQALVMVLKPHTPLTTATAGFRLPFISNLQLMLDVECNQDLRTMIINQVESTGLSYLIPYVQAFKNSNQGTAQNISIQFDQGNGRSLMKVYHAPYNTLKIKTQCMTIQTVTQLLV